MQGTRGVVLPLPVALQQQGEGGSADARSVGASGVVTGESGGDDSVLVRWELAPRLGAGQLLLLAGMHASIATLEKEVRWRRAPHYQHTGIMLDQRGTLTGSAAVLQQACMLTQCR